MGIRLPFTVDRAFRAEHHYHLFHRLFAARVSLSRIPTLGASYMCLDCFAALAMTALLLCPAAPARAQLQVCANQGFSLVSAEPASGIEPITYKWYENSIPINNSNTASLSFSAGKATTGTYEYVRVAANSACTLSSNSYTVEVLEAPAAPTAPSANTRCGSGTVTFSASVPEGVTIDWYNAATGGATVTGGYGVTSFAPTVTPPATYYAQARIPNTSCVSETRLPVAAALKPSYPTSDGGCTGGCNTAYVQLRDGCTTNILNATYGTYTNTTCKTPYSYSNGACVNGTCDRRYQIQKDACGLTITSTYGPVYDSSCQLCCKGLSTILIGSWPTSTSCVYACIDWCEAEDNYCTDYEMYRNSNKCECTCKP
jgi:hypothetical protein